MEVISNCPFPLSTMFISRPESTKHLSLEQYDVVSLSSFHSRLWLHRRSQTKAVSQKTASSFFKFIDDYISDHFDPPLHPGIDPETVLSGNFAPVGELPPTPCTVVEGNLPPSLNGSYIRNGPNPQFLPSGPYHFLDGDGMLHAVTIDDGRVVYCSRFVQTNKYKTEQEAGYPFFLSVFSSFNGVLPSMARIGIAMCRMISGRLNLCRGFGVANTSLFNFAGKLYALCESDLPYEVELTPDGDVITLGRDDSFCKKGILPMITAHPKIDPDSGEAFAMRFSLIPPFLFYFKINALGIKQPEVPISSLREFSLIHDFAITKSYVIFPENQIVFRPINILTSHPMVDVDPEKSPRIGILPRNAKNDREICLVDLPGKNILHAVNAWEEDGGDTVFLVVTNLLRAENFVQQFSSVRASLNLVEINVKAKTAKWTPLYPAVDRDAGFNIELPIINPRYIGRKNRYIYGCTWIGSPVPNGIVKVDVSKVGSSTSDCVVAHRRYPAGIHIGEACFVAKNSDDPTADEDDGYLLNYIYDEKSDESKFIVMDAKSPTLDTIAAVKIPQRVPNGFHTIFVPKTTR